MRSLLSHCKDFGSVITGLATRPEDVVHGDILDPKQSMQDCILVFLTLEKGDSETKIQPLVDEILKFTEETGHSNVFLCPFAHLSNSLASSSEALPLLQKTTDNLRDKCNLMEGHFGSDKELLIHLFGHPGNARFREF